MPTLKGRGPFSYESLAYNSGNTYALNAGSATAPKTQFDSTNGETLEVLANGVLLEGDGSVANATDAAAQSPAHGFYVNSLTTPTSITLVSNISGGQSVLIRRISNRATPQIDFAPGSVIREQDLDDSTNQTLHVAQEAIDIALQSMTIDTDDKWDAQTASTNRVIKGVADGVADNDAANKGQVTATEATTGGLRDDAIDAKDTATDYATRTGAVVRHFSAASGGSSGAGVDQAGVYSSKEFAIGTTASTGGSAKDYATYTGGGVRGETGDHSAKAWAVGGTGVTTTASKGAAKEWASGSGLIDTVSYSAKEYSQSTTAGTSTYGGSAKGWSQTAVDTAVPGAGSGDRSALHYSTAAANSATSAKASAASVASIFDSFNDTYLGTMADGASATDADTTGTWAINSNVITVASATNIVVGQEVTGSGIPTDANVIAVAGTSITISENMVAAGSGVDLDFRGQGVYGAFNGTKDGPSTDNDGGALANGMLYFNTTDNAMMVYKETGAQWIQTSASGGVSLVMHKATASGSETSLANTDFSPTLSYEANNIIVFLNGVKLDATDYTASSGTTITGLSALAASDEVVVLAFKTFEVGDAVSAASGGTFNGDVIMSTTKKIKQKGAFMQSSTHQALTLGA